MSSVSYRPVSSAAAQKSEMVNVQLLKKNSYNIRGNCLLLFLEQSFQFLTNELTLLTNKTSPLKPSTHWRQGPLKPSAHWQQGPLEPSTHWQQGPLKSSTHWRQGPLKSSTHWQQGPLKPGTHWQQGPLEPSTHWQQSWIQHGRLCWQSTVSLWSCTHWRQSRPSWRQCRLQQAVEFRLLLIYRQNQQQSRPYRQQSTLLPICRRFWQQSTLSLVCTGLKMVTWQFLTVR